MYQLPQLNYEWQALEPHIDALTMQIHYQKHHATYVDKLNQAVAPYHETLAGMSVEQLLEDVASLPENIHTAVRNHGGGHLNHTLFWHIIAPGGEKEPKNQVFCDSLEESFGSLESFRDQFSQLATSHFGSGWAWLVINQDNNLEIYSTANQDSPVMRSHKPILGLDVWEHAYYLKYQNRRPEYVQAFWQVLNWTNVESIFQDAVSA